MLVKTLSDPLTEQIIASALAVHTELGPGLLESVYQTCLAIELQRSGLRVESGRAVPITYRDVSIDCDLRLDLVVEERVIVEIKAVPALHPVFQAQVITYLKLTGIPVGLILNFNVPVMKHGIRRVEHPDLYKQKKSPVSPAPVKT